MKNNDGFTLVELIIAVAILSIVATISVTAYVSNAKISQSVSISRQTRESKVGVTEQAFTRPIADMPSLPEVKVKLNIPAASGGEKIVNARLVKNEYSSGRVGAIIEEP